MTSLLRRSRTGSLLAALVVAPFVGLQAQGDAPARPANRCDSLCIVPTRTISFETTEGTQMNVDLSPDGKTIVFDLLGDLYTIPRAGGTATRLTSGMAIDVQPVFSPDGKQILFVSDRSGNMNLWTINADGTNPTPITKDRSPSSGDPGFRNPEWSPDGEYIMVTKNRTGGDGGGRGAARQLWLYHRSGGTGTELAKDVAGSGYRWGSSGRYIYFTVGGGAAAADVPPGQVKRIDRNTGDVATITATPTGAVRPALSPDGKWLAYVSDVDAKGGLRLRNLETDDDQWLAFPIDWEAPQNRTRFSFTPDGSAIVYVTGGTFHEVNLQTRQVKKIAFTAKVEQQLGKLIYREFQQPQDSFVVRNIRNGRINRDRTKLVYASLNQIWIMDLPSGKPRPLVQQSGGQYQPAFSPDGAHVAYVSWNEAEGGHLWRVPVQGGTPQRLTTQLAYYAIPTWSADGSKIAFVREAASAEHNRNTRTMGMMQWMPSTGGAPQSVISVQSDNNVTFTLDGTHITYADSGALISVRLDGTEKRTLVKVPQASEIVPSPDGKWVAFTLREEVYVGALGPPAEPPTINELVGPGPVKRVARAGGQDLKWEDGGRTLTWVFANNFSRLDLDKVFGSGPTGAAVAATAELAEVIPANLKAAVSRPSGTVALKGATVVTMRGDEVLRNATIVVTDDRIRAIGASGAVTIPAGARVINVTGKTIIPGLIDMHAHIRGMPRDVLVQGAPEPLVNLAFGVTTARDVNHSTDQFHYSELIAAGRMLGPRIFTAGPSMVVAALKIDNYADALWGVRRLASRGAIGTKQYLQPQRRQIQWMLQAADEVGINSGAEGGGIMHEVAMVLDGYTSFEHAPTDLVNVYNDVVQLFARSKTLYTPTLIVAAPSTYQGESYWYQTTKPHEDEKLLRFLTHDAIDKFTRRSVRYAEDEYYFLHGGSGAAPILQAGGNVATGGHGQLHGIAVHWELWMLQMVGMTPLEALRAATIMGAAGLGMKKDFGSLEVGKVADLLVLDKSPLENIRNSTTIRYVMKGGEMYDGNTLAMVWPRQEPLKPFKLVDFGPPPKP